MLASLPAADESLHPSGRNLSAWPWSAADTAAGQASALAVGGGRGFLKAVARGLQAGLVGLRMVASMVVQAAAVDSTTIAGVNLHMLDRRHSAGCHDRGIADHWLADISSIGDVMTCYLGSFVLMMKEMARCRLLRHTPGRARYVYSSATSYPYAAESWCFVANDMHSHAKSFLSVNQCGANHTCLDAVLYVGCLRTVSHLMASVSDKIRTGGSDSSAPLLPMSVHRLQSSCKRLLAQARVCNDSRRDGSMF